MTSTQHNAYICQFVLPHIQYLIVVTLPHFELPLIPFSCLLPCWLGPAFYDLATPKYDIIDFAERAARGGDGVPLAKVQTNNGMFKQITV